MAESPEVITYRLADIDKKLDQILEQVKRTNGRVDRAEDEIIRLTERTGPWTAGGIVSGLGIVAYALWEKLSK
jgi:hypothetical protein